jgi:hypothetical protein
MPASLNIVSVDTVNFLFLAMGQSDRKQRREKSCKTRKAGQVSWYPPVPHISLDIIRDAGLPGSAGIIDVGGADRFLADDLLGMGYENIAILDSNPEKSYDLL